MKILKKIIVFTLVLNAILSLFACKVNSTVELVAETSAAPAMYMGVNNAASGFSRANAKMMAVSADSVAESNNSNADTTSDRKIVKTVDINCETKTFDESIKWLKSYITSFGGTIESSYIDSGNKADITYKKNANFAVRIPAEKLDSFLSKIGSNLNVTFQQENVQDVTDNYDDTESRINTLKIEEAKLTELLAKAKTVDEMIKVEEKLSDVRRELERISKRLARLEKSIAYSSVYINLTEVKDLTTVIEPQNISKEMLYKELNKNYEAAKQFVIGLGIYLFTHLPYIILILLAILVVLILILIIRAISSPKPKKEKSESKNKKVEAKASTKKKTSVTKKKVVNMPAPIDTNQNIASIETQTPENNQADNQPNG